jgi:hypothetical protein
MKKITLIVPDKIDHVIGSSRQKRSKAEEVTPDNIKKALCDRKDYHQYYYFSITILNLQIASRLFQLRIMKGRARSMYCRNLRKTKE